MKKVLSLLIITICIIAALSSCSKDTNTNNPVVTYSITGHWLGQQNYNSLLTIKMDLNLTDVAGAVGGTGKVTYTPVLGSASSIDIPVVAGTFSNPDVNLSFSGITFTGKLSADQKQIVGKATVPNVLTGSGTIQVDMTLVKQ